MIAAAFFSFTHKMYALLTLIYVPFTAFYGKSTDIASAAGLPVLHSSVFRRRPSASARSLQEIR